jgi:hypothetical protein
MELLQYTILQWSQNPVYTLLVPKDFHLFDQSPTSLRDWKPIFTFFAVNPEVKLIPSGMNLFCALQSPSFPYHTTEIRVVYDNFKLQDGCVYFIAYNQPSPYTHRLPPDFFSNQKFPDFDSNIYVLTHPMPFKYVQGRCLPWPDGKYKTIQDCVFKH